MMRQKTEMKWNLQSVNSDGINVTKQTPNNILGRFSLQLIKEQKKQLLGANISRQMSNTNALNSKLIPASKNNTMSFEQLKQKMNSQLEAFTKKNSALQRKADAQNDPQFMKNFDNQKNQMKEELISLNQTLAYLQEKGKATHLKKIVNNFQEELQKQKQKFETSVKQIINSSFSQKIEARRSFGQNQSAGSPESEGSNSNKYDIDDQTMQQQKALQQQQQQLQQQQQQKQHQQQSQDLDIEEEIQKEKQSQLNQFDIDMRKMNDNFKDMIKMIDSDQEKLDVIQEDTFETNQQVIKANQEMNSADKIQRSTKKKYIVFALLILIALGITLTIVFTQM